MKKAFKKLSFQPTSELLSIPGLQLFLLNIEISDVDNKPIRAQSFLPCADNIQIKIRNLRRKTNTKITGTRCFSLQIIRKLLSLLTYTLFFLFNF